MKSIPFNIWDDFWDDGYVPKGEVQETHGYIEEYDQLTNEEKRPILKYIYNYFKKELDLTGVTMKLGANQIDFINITHARLDYIMERLEKCKLRYKGIPIDFYSES